MNDQTPISEFGLLRVYRPTRDWAGIGYSHWMVALTNSADKMPRCGVGHSLRAAMLDFVTNWGSTEEVFP